MSKYSRSKLFKSELVDGNLEIDFLTNAFSDFRFEREKTFYTVKEYDLLRPDIISFKNYRTIDYWYIIMKYNNIQDIYNDLKVGDVLTIPHIRDIEEFYAFSRNRF